MSVIIENNQIDHQLLTSPMGRHLIFDGGSNLWMIYCLGGSVYLRKSTDSGSTWGSGISGYTSSDITIDYPQESAMVYDTTTNTIFAIYHTCPEEKLYARSFDVASETWNADGTEITSITTPIWHIGIDRDYNGRLWICYANYKRYITTTPTCEYYVRRSTNADSITAWGSDVDLGGSGSFDGYGQVSICCRKKDSTDEVVVLYGKWTTAANYNIYSRRNNGSGDGAGNWDVELLCSVNLTFSASFGTPTDYAQFYNFRTHSYHTSAWVDADTFYIIVCNGATVYLRQIDWTGGAWVIKDSGTVTGGTIVAATVGYSTSKVRLFMGLASTLKYTTYDIGTNLWDDTTTQLEAEGPFVMSCSEGRPTLTDNRIIYQTKASTTL